MTQVNRTEPTVGVLSSLFSGGKKKIKPVSDILSSLKEKIDELKVAAEQHAAKIGENKTKINELETENRHSEAEIEQATRAHANMSALIGLPVSK